MRGIKKALYRTVFSVGAVERDERKVDISERFLRGSHSPAIEPFAGFRDDDVERVIALAVERIKHMLAGAQRHVVLFARSASQHRHPVLLHAYSIALCILRALAGQFPLP